MMKTLLCTVLALFTSAPILASGSEGGGRDSKTWVEEEKLLAGDGGAFDSFGLAVALDEDTAIIAAKGDGTLGTAYVFVRIGSTWSEQAKLVPADGSTGGGYGHSVAIDGETVLVGRRDDDEAGSQAGSVHVYIRSGTAWSEQAKLLARDAGAADLFGTSVALDGDTALIGACHDDHHGASGAGSAYVFVRSGTTWSQHAKLVADDAQAEDDFGWSVSISGDTALVGAPGGDDSHWEAGSAYVFVWSGTSWNQQAKLLAGSPEYHSALGFIVSISGDTAMLGAPNRYFGSHAKVGAVHVFERSGTIWNEQALLMASDLATGQHFGSHLALSGDRAVIGRHVSTESMPTVAYIFERQGHVWEQQAKLEAHDGEAEDYFGISVSVSGDSALVGAFADDDLGPTSGSAYVFSHLDPPGSGYCFGDPGSGTPCPCDNDNDGSVPGSGCDNGVFSSGAKLVGIGRASVSDDSVVLLARNLDPHLGGLYYQGTTDLTPGLVWGGGLRCTGGAIKRLQVRFADGTGSSSTTIPIATKGGVSAGDTTYYQLWYRATTAPPCGSGVSEFNASNGYVVTWVP